MEAGRALGADEETWREAVSALSRLPEGGWGAAVKLLKYPGSGGTELPLVCLGRGREKFRAASVIKVGIAAALLAGVHDRQYSLEDTLNIESSQVVEGGVLSEFSFPRRFSLSELLRLMIVVSDNTAANLLLDLLGRERVNAFLKERLGLRHSVINRFFMHSPELEGENYTSAEDCAEMLSELWQEGVLSGSYRAELWSVMSRQMFIEKLPNELPVSVKHYNKTGELDDGVRSDIGVFQCGPLTWSAAFLTDQQAVSAAETDRIISKFSAALFKALAKSYNI